RSMALKITQKKPPAPAEVPVEKKVSKTPTTPSPPLSPLQALSEYRGMPVQAMYSRSELAKLCNCGERTIQNWEKRGDLKPCGIPGRGSYYYAQDVEEFLKVSKERRKGRRKKP